MPLFSNFPKNAKIAIFGLFMVNKLINDFLLSMFLNWTYVKVSMLLAIVTRTGCARGLATGTIYLCLSLYGYVTRMYTKPLGGRQRKSCSNQKSYLTRLISIVSKPIKVMFVTVVFVTKFFLIQNKSMSKNL